MALVLLTANTTDYVVTLADLKTHCRIEHTADDILLGDYARAAEQYVALDLGRSLLAGSAWLLTLDKFPAGCTRAIRLPMGPVQSVSSVKYYATTGTLTTMSSSDYVLDGYSTPARLEPAYGTYWPATRERSSAVEIRYTAGGTLGGTGTFPEAICHAVKLLVGHWYENREPVNVDNITSTLDYTVKALLAPHKVWEYA